MRVVSVMRVCCAELQLLNSERDFCDKPARVISTTKQRNRNHQQSPANTR